MSKEKAKQFLKEYRDNEEVVKILKQFPEPKTDEEAISCLVEAAGKLGLRITEEEMAEAARELKEERKAKTDAATHEVQALGPDDLEDVAGGIYYINKKGKRLSGCYVDFTDTSCFNMDACAKNLNFYYDCQGTYFERDGEFKCRWNQRDASKLDCLLFDK